MARKNEIASLGLTLCLITIGPEALAHAGHGNEFHNNAASHSTGKQIPIDAETAQRIGLKVEAVNRQSLDARIQATGQIERLPNRKVEITNPVGGTITQLLVQPGDTVKAGQVLAVMTSGELAELRITALENSAERQGEVQQAQASLNLAKQNYARQRQIAVATINQARTKLRVAQEQFDRDQVLAEKGAIPRRAYLDSEANLAEMRQGVTEAESQLGVLEAKNEIEHSEIELEAALSRVKLSSGTYQTRLQQLGANANSDGTVTLRSPISGRVTDRAATLGQSAEDAGEILMTIVDDDQVLATANLYEKDLEAIAQGQRVQVRVPSLPNQVFTGQITTIGATVEGDSRVVPVRVALNNGNGALKPGMFAELEVQTHRAAASVIAIPQSAIVDANGQPLVFVENGTQFQPVKVSLGKQVGQWVEVKTGLFEGDRIVTQRANQLYAQSLRSGGAESDAHPEAEEQAPASVSLPIPWWAIALGGGALGLGTFAAGMLWSKRSPLSAPVIQDHSDPSLPPPPRLNPASFPTLVIEAEEESEASSKAS